MTSSNGFTVVKAKGMGNDTRVEIQLNLGHTLEDAVKAFGPEVVLHLFKMGAKKQAEHRLRNIISGDNPPSVEEAVEKMQAWTPRVPSAGTSQAEKLIKKYGSKEAAIAALEAI